MSKKTLQVHCLETDKASKLYKGLVTNEFYLTSQEVVKLNNRYFIYFTSKDEIKQGDEVGWYILIDGFGHHSGGPIYYKKKERQVICDTHVKIEATTDPSLNLPLIPEQFIQEFVKQNGSIKEVEVELKNNGTSEQGIFEKGLLDDASSAYPINTPPCWYNWIIKTNPDNTVIWSLKEEKVYSRDEVHQLLWKLHKQEDFTSGGLAISDSSFNKWIEENLK